jgi:hypothetical protein
MATTGTEAVNISGSRKGEIITLPIGEVELPPEAEAVLDGLIEGADRLAANARAAADEATALRDELRQRRNGR